VRGALLAQLAELATSRLDQRGERLALAPPVLDLALALLDVAAQREQRLAALGQDALALAQLEALRLYGELALGELRVAYQREIASAAAPFDAVVMPTLPCVPPTIAAVSSSDEEYFRWNMRILRNCGLINFLDGCAASVPCNERGAAPVLFMVCGTADTDRRILAVAAAIERQFARR